MVQVQIGERTYPAHYSARCPVCNHPGRGLIEERILTNDSYVSIAAWVSDVDTVTIEGIEVRWPPLTTTQLSHHFNSNHCPVDARVLKELSEQRAEQLGVDYNELTGPFVDHLVYAKMVLLQGQQRLARGEIKATMRDTLAAARLLADIESAAEGEDGMDQLQAYADAMEQYFLTVQRIVSPEQWQQIGTALEANPVLKQIAAGLEIQDAEIVEER
jgi:hypothetical protein